jgi:hypothetical protein
VTTTTPLSHAHPTIGRKKPPLILQPKKYGASEYKHPK